MENTWHDLVYLVHCVLLPIADVDDSDAAHEQLELALVKDLDQVKRDEFVEAGKKVVHLLLDSRHEPPLDD